MRPLRMRLTMLISLLLVAVAMTLVFLVLIRLTIERQVRVDLEADIQRSGVTFANLQAQRRHLLERTAALVADLPSLKALMTARDARTVADGGAEFWRVSGSSLLALSDQAGHLVSLYNDGAPLTLDSVRLQLDQAVAHPGARHLLAADGRLWEMLSEPIQFGSPETGLHLGYVTLGYPLDRELAHEVGEAAAADVAFVNGNTVIASTLDNIPPGIASQDIDATPGSDRSATDISVAGRHLLARSIPLGPARTPGAPRLIVLKSYDRAARTLHRLNLGVALIGVLGLVAGGILAVSLARTVTRPLEFLLEGTHALAAGDFRYRWKESGALEVRELTHAFRRMQAEIERTQRDLLLADRMATIGRMASSISHDLRHYLTSMYANAEFLSMSGTSTAEREDMLDEVKTAVVGMTDLLDSLLIFGRTGMALQTRALDAADLIQRSVDRVRSHPDARSVDILAAPLASVQLVVDPQELDRAVYNLLLNACQAARRSSVSPRVLITTVATQDLLFLSIEDNGPGVPGSIRETLFQPFVSEGKQNGTGLGLALSARIVEAHAGSLDLQASAPGQTIFCLKLPLPSPETRPAEPTQLERKL